MPNMLTQDGQSGSLLNCLAYVTCAGHVTRPNQTFVFQSQCFKAIRCPPETNLVGQIWIFISSRYQKWMTRREENCSFLSFSPYLLLHGSACHHPYRGDQSSSATHSATPLFLTIVKVYPGTSLGTFGALLKFQHSRQNALSGLDQSCLNGLKVVFRLAMILKSDFCMLTGFASVIRLRIKLRLGEVFLASKSDQVCIWEESAYAAYLYRRGLIDDGIQR